MEGNWSQLCKREKSLEWSTLFSVVFQAYKRDYSSIYFVHISIVNERANCQMMPNPFHVTATQMKKRSLIWHIRTSLCLLRIFLTIMSVAVLGICSNEDWHLLWDHLSCRSQRGLCWIFDLQITIVISMSKYQRFDCYLHFGKSGNYCEKIRF